MTNIKKETRKRKNHPVRPRSRGGQVHSWRVCPYGQHQVVEHTRHNPPSKTHPEGSVSTVRWHCAHNPTGRDQLYPDEIREIGLNHFKAIKKKPCPMPLERPNGSKYDDLIAGWTQYWNDVLKPKIPLDPNLVKALVASESGFDPLVLANRKNSNSARGLTQITNATRKILGDENGELKDHYITATKKDLNDPSINICAGVRWLFRKRDIATAKLKHDASWEEAVFEYKGLDQAPKARQKELWDRFKKFYERLKTCKK